MTFTSGLRPVRVLCVLLATLAVSGVCFDTAAQSKIKLATLAPDGSPWHVELKTMGQEWQDKTDGRVRLVVYPGGVAGDDPDMVRKMRIGQLHSAALTITGLAEIDPAFNIFWIPLFYESFEELAFVRDKLSADMSRRLSAKGYVLVHWGFGGWVHYFSKKPAATVDETRKLKIFTWAGDSAMLAIYKQNDFHAVPLAATDIMTGLQTGMVEAVPATPLAALSLQWFRQTPYMLDLPIAPLLGATIMSKRTWNKLSEADRKAVLEAGQTAERNLDQQIPVKDAQAIVEMRERGLTVVPPAGGDTQWTDLAETFSLLTSSIPAEVMTAAKRYRSEFRASQPADDTDP